LPGLPDMSRCQNNVCNKNQKLKSYHNAVLHGRERERERACRVRGPARPPAVPAAGPRPCPPGPSTAAHPGTAAPPIDFKSSVHILNPLHMYNVHAVTVQAFQEIKTFTVQAFQEIKSLKRFRGATRNGEYYHDMMACDGSSKPDSEFVQVQVARCNKISSLESPKIFSCGLRLYRPWKTLSGC
jgi:hypothetical protein